MGIADLPNLAVEPATTSIVVETVATVAFLSELMGSNLDTLHPADLERLAELGEVARRELGKRGGKQ